MVFNDFSVDGWTWKSRVSQSASSRLGDMFVVGFFFFLGGGVIYSHSYRIHDPLFLFSIVSLVVFLVFFFKVYCVEGSVDSMIFVVSHRMICAFCTLVNLIAE